MEALRLRVKDLDFERRELTVRDGKGGKDRLTLLPQSLVAELQHHLLDVRRLHQLDLAAGWGEVLMPYALARKYPNAAREWAWQWVFPQQHRWHERSSGTQGRHGSWRVQGGQLPHLPPFVRHPPAGARAGHPDNPGTARPQGCEHHDDLYPHAQPRATGCPQPRRQSVANRTCGLRTREPRLYFELVHGNQLALKGSAGCEERIPLWLPESKETRSVVHGTLQ
ncbi:protein of unknown function [Cyanobium sp. NIES-981]|nr:protein of unknown function [Cyanobium sp. NIES-981]